MSEIAQWILDIPDTEGVSFSGGEPFAQARSLASLARYVKANGKSVVIFSGFTRKALWDGGDPAWRELLSWTDLLICGPFQRNNPSSHPLLGSDNQELVCLPDRYEGYDFGPNSKRVELHINPEGTLVMTGLGNVRIP